MHIKTKACLILPQVTAPLGYGCKFSLYGVKYNTYRCRHIHCDVITTSYPNTNPNHKKGIKYRARNSNPNPKIAIYRKRWRIAALGLGLGFLG